MNLARLGRRGIALLARSVTRRVLKGIGDIDCGIGEGGGVSLALGAL